MGREVDNMTLVKVDQMIGLELGISEEELERLVKQQTDHLLDNNECNLTLELELRELKGYIKGLNYALENLHNDMRSK